VAGKSEEEQAGGSIGVVRSLQDGARLSYKYAFGVSPSLNHGAIAFCSVSFNKGEAGIAAGSSQQQDGVCFPVGRSVALYQLDDGEMHFLPPHQGVTRVISVAVSPNKKLVAVCEQISQGENPTAQLSVYGLNSMTLKSTLVVPSTPEFPDFICAAFTGESKVVYALTGDKVVGWHWEREKVLYTKSLRDGQGTSAGAFNPCSRINVNPGKSDQITLSGPGHLKFLTPHVENSMKMYPLLVAAKERDQFIDHTWAGKQKGGHWLVAATDGSQSGTGGVRVATIYVLDAPEGNPSTPAPPAQTLHPRLPAQGSLEAVAGYGKGFAGAGSGGYFCVWEQTDDRKEPFALLRILDAGEYSFRALAFAGHGEVGAAYSMVPSARPEGSFQVSTFPLSNIDSLMEHEPNPDEIYADFNKGSNQAHFFSPLIPGGTHKDKVTSMSICIQQPLLVTLGETEKTLRVWDYLTWQCRFEHLFRSEEPTSTSIHPTGFQLLVSLKDRVRVYNILADSLRYYRELAAKNCRAVAYSRGGHYWACAVGLNISVYTSYSFTLLHNLQIHTAPPKTLVWGPDDSHLYAADLNGNAFEWDLVERRQLHHMESSDFRSSDEYKGLLVHASDRSFIIAASAYEMRQVTWVMNSEATIPLEYQKLDPPFAVGADDHITCTGLSSSGKWLFCGMESGDVRIYPVPLQQDEESVLNTFRVHPGPILALQVSYDDAYLFASTEDGCIYTLSLQEVERGVANKLMGPDARSFNTEAVLVSQDLIYAKTQKISELKKMINETETEFTFKQHQLEREHKDKLTSEVGMKDKDLEKERERYQKLTIDFEEAARVHTETLDMHDSNHMQKMKELENQYEHKLANEMERYDKLSEEIEAMQQRCEGLLDSKAIEEEQTLRDLEIRYKKELREKELEIKKLKEDLVHNDAVTKETLDQQEAEYEKELQSLMAVAEKELAAQREEKAKIRASLEARRTQRDQYKKALKETKTQNEKLEEENRKLRKEKKELEDTYGNQQKNLVERETTLSEKERIIQDLRSNNRTLDNFRFVLDHRLQQLMEERGPITKHIEDLENFIHKMYEELVQEGNTQKEKDRNMIGKDEKIAALTSEVTKSRNQLRDKERYISSFKRELAVLVSMTVPKDLEDGVKLCYKKFVRGEKAHRGKAANPTAYKDKAKSATALIKEAGDGSASSSSESGFESSSDDEPGKRGGRKVRKGQVAAVELELVERAEEAQRQVAYMQTATGKLKTRLEMTKRISARQNRMKLGENSALIKECNDLRRDNYTLRRENDHIKQNVKDLEGVIARITEQSSMAASESQASVSVGGSSQHSHQRRKGKRSPDNRSRISKGRPLASSAKRGPQGFMEGSIQFTSSMPSLHSNQQPHQIGANSFRGSLREGAVGMQGQQGTGRLVLGSAMGIQKVSTQEHDIDRMVVELEQKGREMEMQKIEIAKLRDIIKQTSAQSGSKPFETKYYGLGPESSGHLVGERPDSGMRSQTVPEITGSRRQSQQW